MASKFSEHFVIPDTQVKPGVYIDHLEAAANYIVDKKPNVVVHLGDHFDMHSLSSYDKGTKKAEGARYELDIQAGIIAMETFFEPINRHNRLRIKKGLKPYKPRYEFLLGNHEQRIERHVNANAELAGKLSYADLELEKLGWHVNEFLAPVEIDGVAYCLHEDHRVLTTELKHVPLKDISVGDTLVSFDEHGTPRKFRTGVVTQHGFDERELFEVTLSDGTQFRATQDHLWLARKYPSSGYEWLRTDELKPGRSKAIKICDVWDTDNSNGAGYLAGVFDGEGYVSSPCGGTGRQGGIQIGFSQKQNPCLRKSVNILNELGFTHSIHAGGGTNGDVMQVRVTGPSGKKMELLGRIRADRLIQNFRAEKMGRVQVMDGRDTDTLVMSVKPAGKGRIVKIKIDTGTMIADGYAHHNCHYFYNQLSGNPIGGTAHNKLNRLKFSFTMGHVQGLDYAIMPLNNQRMLRGLVAGSFYQHNEDYKGPQANDHWQGCIYKHEVKDGNYCFMELSLQYLLRQWS